jgi:hypothetical protein
MPDRTHDDDRDDHPDDDGVEPDGPDRDDVDRAARIARRVGAENPDPVTRREAIELELEDEGLSEAGEALGDHVE